MAERYYTQDKTAEQNALADLLKQGSEGGANSGIPYGTDVSSYLDANPATRGLVQEGVYQRAYGTARPNFGTAPSLPGSGVPEVPYGSGATGASPAGAPPAAPGGGAATDLQNILKQIQDTYGPTTPRTPEEIRAAALASIQGQIDSIKGSYVPKFNAEQIAGENRVGQTRGLETVSGVRYSPRGEAQMSGTVAANKSAIDALYADQAKEIAAANREALGFAQNDIQLEAEAQRSRADGLIASLLSAYGLEQQDVANAGAAADRAAALTGYYNGQETLGLKQYLSGLDQNAFNNNIATSENERNNRYIDAQIGEMQKKNYSIVQADDGSILAINPNDPADRVTIGTYSRLPTGGGTSSGGGGTSSGGTRSSGSTSSGGGTTSGGITVDDLSDYEMGVYNAVINSKDPGAALLSLSTAERNAYIKAQTALANEQAKTAASSTGGGTAPAPAPAPTPDLSLPRLSTTLPGLTLDSSGRATSGFGSPVDTSRLFGQW